MTMTSRTLDPMLRDALITIGLVWGFMGTVSFIAMIWLKFHPPED
jgi:uncharacterized membrane protein